MIAEGLTVTKTIKSVHLASPRKFGGHRCTVDITIIPSRRADGSPQLAAKFSRRPHGAISNQLTYAMYARDDYTWGMKSNVRAKVGVIQLMSILGGYKWTTHLAFDTNQPEAVEQLLQKIQIKS